MNASTRPVYAHGRRGLPRGLHAGLHRSRRCPKHRLPGSEEIKASPLGEFNLIRVCPSIAEDRNEVGHLKGDLIVGSFNRSAIATVFDRASRHLWLADFPADHDADATLAALCEILERIPEPLRRTLTWHQGREMARHVDLVELCGIDVYFAEPHSPWQRPTNENGNGLIRRYVGGAPTNHELLATNALFGRRAEDRNPTAERGGDSGHGDPGSESGRADDVVTADVADRRQGVVLAEHGDSRSRRGPAAGVERGRHVVGAPLHVEAVVFEHSSQDVVGVMLLEVQLGIGVYGV